MGLRGNYLYLYIYVLTYNTIVTLFVCKSFWSVTTQSIIVKYCVPTHDSHVESFSNLVGDDFKSTTIRLDFDLLRGVTAIRPSRLKVHEVL